MRLVLEAIAYIPAEYAMAKQPVRNYTIGEDDQLTSVQFDGGRVLLRCKLLCPEGVKAAWKFADSDEVFTK